MAEAGSLAAPGLDAPADLEPGLRPRAAEILRASGAGELVTVAVAGRSHLPAGNQAYVAGAVPAVVRVWRRSKAVSSDSCRGQVDEIPLEQYVRGVLPREWIPSWDPESLKAGAVAARTYAVFWTLSGGKYDCADVDDTTASQVYDETASHPATDAAVQATAGLVIERAGEVVFAEYSAENGSPTAHGVDEPLCAGKARNGHGRGMCQWGSQRWAQQGKDFRWISQHYYPGATVGRSAVGGGGVPDDGEPARGGDSPGRTQPGPDQRPPVRPPGSAPMTTGIEGGCGAAPAAATGICWWFVAGAVALLARRRRR
jgi:hypothetical protein